MPSPVPRSWVPMGPDGPTISGKGPESSDGLGLQQLRLQPLDLLLDEGLGEVRDDFPGDLPYDLLRDLRDDALSDLGDVLDRYGDLSRVGSGRGLLGLRSEDALETGLVEGIRHVGRRRHDDR